MACGMVLACAFRNHALRGQRIDLRVGQAVLSEHVARVLAQARGARLYSARRARQLGHHARHLHVDTRLRAHRLDHAARAVVRVGGDIGDGLKGEYYIWDSRLGNTPDRADVYKPENLKLTRIDPNVNFGWAAGVPAPGVRSDYFAV